jgi:hypothetical protein
MNYTPIYIDPADVEVKTINGARVARIAWERPCSWDAKGADKWTSRMANS